MSSLLFVGCVAQPRWQGPMPVRNQHPAQLTVMHMAPARATVLPPGETAGHLDAAYSSLFLQGANQNGSWIMDGEYLRTAASLRVGLGDDLELAAELPFAHASGGFLDSFIIDYHRLFGFPDQNRSEVPKNRFAVSANEAGGEVWGVEARSLELLDVPLQLTWQLQAAAPGRPGLALRGGIELPTGNDGRGYGSGQFDYSLGAVAEYQTGGVAWYGHLQHTFAGTPSRSRRAGFSFADVTSCGLAAELPLTDDLHAFVQTEWENSALRHLDLPQAADNQALLWVGARLRTGGRWAVEVALGEDLLPRVSPDFTAWLGVAWLPAGADGGG